MSTESTSSSILTSQGKHSTASATTPTANLTTPTDGKLPPNSSSPANVSTSPVTVSTSPVKVSTSPVKVSTSSTPANLSTLPGSVSTLPVNVSTSPVNVSTSSNVSTTTSKQFNSTNHTTSNTRNDATESTSNNNTISSTSPSVTSANSTSSGKLPTSTSTRHNFLNSTTTHSLHSNESSSVTLTATHTELSTSTNSSSAATEALNSSATTSILSSTAQLKTSTDSTSTELPTTIHTFTDAELTTGITETGKTEATKTTDTSATTAESTTVTTSRPLSYLSCNCSTGILYLVEGTDKTKVSADCFTSCPSWSSTTEYCFCAVNPSLQYARTCVEGSNVNGHFLEGPFTCDPGHIETNITSTWCECPEIVKVDQCDCHSGYGRIGEECHYHHPRPIEGVCSENNVNPYVCSEKCSRYTDWKSWSACAPCGIGNENGTYTRTRSCVLPNVFDNTTDYMGSEVCTTNQTVTTECSCGYIWSEWGSCDCSSEKQQRNRCYEDNYPPENDSQDMVTLSIVNTSDNAWCISEKGCGEYCPYYSLKWGDWEKCNCLQNRRFLDCLFPSNPSGISLINFICEEPLAEYKDCSDPGCYSDWSDWAQCPCGASHSSR
ncbi:hypothetical protein EB796_019045 [Bugula neritina]|uniref:Uncharacterized protein n=1 Tax=Bugula neritina TaxID=10212 RepID=A0A7J7JB95_BUGNE|nr:hypothetical protein EB796_019045 [Bugula neritina]